MKRIVLAVFIAFMCLNMTGCSHTQPNPSVNSQTEVSNEDSVFDISDSISIIIDNGNQIVQSVENINDMDQAKQFDRLCQAERYAAVISDEISDVLERYDGNREVQNVIYQLKLIQHITPQTIKNDSTSIKNAIVLYQMYLQQLSSSFSLISVYTDPNNNSTDSGKEVFAENSQMPIPSSIIFGISFIDSLSEDDVIKYTFNSGDDLDAMMNYNLYLIALGMDTGLTLSFDGSAVYIYDGSNMVSVIMAGNDAEIGNFFFVSFPQK